MPEIPTKPAIGKMRRAALIKKGYAVHSTNQDTGAVTWPLVTMAMQIKAPLRVTRLYLDDGTEFGFHADDEIMCRTPGEIAKAEELEAKAS